MLFSLFNKKKGPEFITGRVATRQEVKFGFFSVVTDAGEEISKPHPVIIPQKVTHINQDTKEKSQGTLIQAEEVIKTPMKGKIICAVKLDNGQTLHCLVGELMLSKKN